MILGKMGKLPGELAPEIVALAKEKGLEFYTGNPQDAFPNELDKFRQIMGSGKNTVSSDYARLDKQVEKALSRMMDKLDKIREN